MTFEKSESYSEYILRQIETRLNFETLHRHAIKERRMKR